MRRSRRGPLLSRGRGARVGTMQPPPCAPLCCSVAPANLKLFAPSRAGGHPFPCHLSARGYRGARREGSSHCCGALFSLLCFGVSFAAIAVSRNIIARLVVWAFPPLGGGYPCRVPAAGATAAP